MIKVNPVTPSVQGGGVTVPVQQQPVQQQPVQQQPVQQQPVQGKTYMYDKLAVITVDLSKHKLDNIKIYVNGAYRRLENGAKIITLLEEAKDICRNNKSYLTFKPYTLDGVTHTDARA